MRTMCFRGSGIVLALSLLGFAIVARHRLLIVPDVNQIAPMLNNTILPRVSGDPATLVFAVLTDAQGANAEPNLARDRHYRQSPWRLAEAVRVINNVDDVAFTIHLGDMIDDYPDTWEVALPIYGQLFMPAYHVLGNHDVRSGGKPEAMRRMQLSDAYYAFDAGDWRMIVLDTSDNVGMLDEAQLAWFVAELLTCRRAIVLGHHPEAFALLAPLMVRAGNAPIYFCGHNHTGGYAQQDGVHMVNLHAMINTPDSNAFAVVRLYDDRIEVDGYGREPDRGLPIASPVIVTLTGN